jgi:hypothetical protein
MTKLIHALLLFLLAAAVHAQDGIRQSKVQDINAKNGRLLMQRLAAQTATYVVYLTDGKTGQVEYSDIWQRTLSLSPDGAQVVLDWKWFREGELARSVRAVADRNTFAPVSEKSSSKKRGDAQFEFSDGSMTRSSGEPVPLTEPVFNWEMDLELFSLLPIESVGQTFRIALMDPFEAVPAYRSYTVVREEPLTVDAAEPGISSWVLRIEYGQDSWAEFWIAKKSQQVMKMRELVAGKYRHKVRLY